MEVLFVGDPFVGALQNDGESWDLPNCKVTFEALSESPLFEHLTTNAEDGKYSKYGVICVFATLFELWIKKEVEKYNLLCPNPYYQHHVLHEKVNRFWWNLKLHNPKVHLIIYVPHSMIIAKYNQHQIFKKHIKYNNWDPVVMKNALTKIVEEHLEFKESSLKRFVINVQFLAASNLENFFNSNSQIDVLSGKDVENTFRSDTIININNYLNDITPNSHWNSELFTDGLYPSKRYILALQQILKARITLIVERCKIESTKVKSKDIELTDIELNDSEQVSQLNPEEKSTFDEHEQVKIQIKLKGESTSIEDKQSSQQDKLETKSSSNEGKQIDQPTKSFEETKSSSNEDKQIDQPTKSECESSSTKCEQLTQHPEFESSSTKCEQLTQHPEFIGSKTSNVYEPIPHHIPSLGSTAGSFYQPTYHYRSYYGGFPKTNVPPPPLQPTISVEEHAKLVDDFLLNLSKPVASNKEKANTDRENTSTKRRHSSSDARGRSDSKDDQHKSKEERASSSRHRSPSTSTKSSSPNKLPKKSSNEDSKSKKLRYSEDEYEEKLAALKKDHEKESELYRVNPKSHPKYEYERKLWETYMSLSLKNLSEKAIETEWARFWEKLLHEMVRYSFKEKKRKLLAEFPDMKKTRSRSRSASSEESKRKSKKKKKDKKHNKLKKNSSSKDTKKETKSKDKHDESDKSKKKEENQFSISGISDELLDKSYNDAVSKICSDLEKRQDSSSNSHVTTFTTSDEVSSNETKLSEEIYQVVKTLNQLGNKLGIYEEAVNHLYVQFTEEREKGTNLCVFIDKDAMMFFSVIKSKIESCLLPQNLSLIQQAIFQDTLDCLTTFTKNYEDSRADINLDISKLARATNGKSCQETIQFLKEVLCIKAVELSKEKLMALYLAVTSYQTSLSSNEAPEDKPLFTIKKEDRKENTKFLAPTTCDDSNSQESKEGAPQHKINGKHVIPDVLSTDKGVKARKDENSPERVSTSSKETSRFSMTVKKKDSPAHINKRENQSMSKVFSKELSSGEED